MEKKDLSFFLNPKSVAVVGASTRSGTWGNRIAAGLAKSGYPGRLYLVNPSTKELLGLPCYAGLDDVPEDVELAVMTIPAELLWQALESCARKGVKGVVIISSGLGEADSQGKRTEQEMAAFARSKNIRIIGPNVSGIYNLHADFFATGGNYSRMKSSQMSFLSQGGFAVHNIISRAYPMGIGVGKFLHTGNEADLQCTDFLDLLGEDPETNAILMYIEGIKDPRHFIRLARRIVSQKPIVVYKGGKSQAGNRAAASHTGALAGSFQIYEGFFRQARCIQASRFDTILELGKALTSFPPLKGSRIGIVTEGGSWGVMLTDCLSRHGFTVPEFSSPLQETLRDLGMPTRASTKNPLDTGAGRGTLSVQNRVSLIDALICSDEVDALIIHGYASIDLDSERTPDWLVEFQRHEEEVLRRAVPLMSQYEKPMLFCSNASPFESTTFRNLVQDEIQVFTRLEDVVDALSAMRLYQQYRCS
ncbi:MAG: acetate--CoA ligase family protein [Desulfatiglandales bacterium]